MDGVQVKRRLDRALVRTLRRFRPATSVESKRAIDVECGLVPRPGSAWRA